MYGRGVLFFVARVKHAKRLMPPWLGIRSSRISGERCSLYNLAYSTISLAICCLSAPNTSWKALKVEKTFDVFTKSLFCFSLKGKSHILMRTYAKRNISISLSFGSTFYFQRADQSSGRASIYPVAGGTFAAWMQYIGYLKHGKGWSTYEENQSAFWARNKWLIAHAESSEAADGAFVGLTGPNLEV